MESINLNLIPQGANPVVHAKQFDEGRGFRFNLFNGTAPIVLTGAETITCNVKKPDGNLVTVAVTNTSSNYVEVYTTLQMCACYGANLGEIRLEEDGNDIGMLNFTLSVEESPLNNGIESESSIHDLQTQIAEGVAEEVAEQYDSANVIFDNVPTSGHGTPYTVTSEGIKTAIDNAFDYDNTASGSIVHIEDGADNIPVKSLVSEIVAVESGNGQPKSPTNPYTISGFDNGVVSVSGKNLFDNSLMVNSQTVVVGDTVTLTATGNFQGSAFAFMPVKQGYKYALNIDSLTSGSGVEIRRYNASGTVTNTIVITQSTVINIADGTTVKISIVYGNRTAGAGTFVLKGFNIVLGEIYQSYEAYNGTTYTFAFGQTVYGGHFDNKGNLVVTHIIVDMGLIDWNYLTVYDYHVFGHQFSDKAQNSNEMCSCYKVTQKARQSLLNYELGTYNLTNALNYVTIRDDDYTDANDFKTAVMGQKLVYELANPITLAIASQAIPTLLGENNIFSNCGDVEVTYYTSKSNDILDFIDSEIGKKNGTNIPIEENSADSIKDYIDTGLSGKADTSDLNDKQDKNVLNIVKHYDTGTSSDAITDIITEYGKVNMVFAFDVPLGYFTGCLTFANDNMGSGFIVLSTTGRFWVVSYVSGTITLTELT